MRAQLNAVDRKIHQAERRIAAWLFLAMIGATFFDVVHRVFSRSPGRLSLWLSRLMSDGSFESAAQIDSFSIPVLSLGILFLLLWAAYRTRAKHGGRKNRLALRAASITLLMGVGVWSYVLFIPEGMVWAPYFGLSCLLWIGLLGASMATHSGQHLALEMGDKLWPKAWLPRVKAVSATIVALFCLTLSLLGFLSVVDHYNDWTSGPGAGLIPSIDWPKWMVFLVVPYSFGMMGLRFIGRAAGVLEEAVPSEVPH